MSAHPSGLSRQNRVRARDLAMNAARLGLRHAPRMHYTQAAARWEGIERRRLAWRGEYPRWADCSAFVSWCLWNALEHFHVRDVVNGDRWRGGYTGTMLEHGVRVTGPILRGDAVIYGSGFPGEHTAICVGGGMVISHGSEAGPFLLPIRYRSDVLQVRRYI